MPIMKEPLLKLIRQSTFGCKKLLRINSLSTCTAFFHQVSLQQMYEKHIKEMKLSNDEIQKITSVIMETNFKLDFYVALAAFHENYSFQCYSSAHRPDKRLVLKARSKMNPLFSDDFAREEAVQVLNNWQHLLSEAKIKPTKKFLQDLENQGLSMPWTIIACYLVKDLSKPRYPLLVYDSFIRSPYPAYLTDFTQEEHEVMIKQAFQNDFPESFDEFIVRIHDPELDERLASLETTLKTPRDIIIQHWKSIVQPTLGALMLERFAEFETIGPLLAQLALETNAEKIEDLKFQEVYPYLTKEAVESMFDNRIEEPLHVQLEKSIHRTGGRMNMKNKMKVVDAYIQLE